MSDSDDTDVLLLIPPNFFIAEISSESDSDIELSSFKSTVIDVPRTAQPNNYSSMSNTDSRHLNAIDNQITLLESVQLETDISSNSTVRSKLNSYHKPDETKFIQPMAKYNQNPVPLSSGSESIKYPFNDGSVIKEIDDFLNVYPQINNREIYNESPLYKITQNQMQRNHFKDQKLIDDIKITERTELENVNQNVTCKNSTVDSNNLISLTDIWTSNGNDNNNAFSDALTLHEERLRRQHCEKCIHILQSRLLEYQQKISVAINVDKTKDEAIKQLKETNLSINLSLDQLKQEHSELKLKNEKYIKLENEFYALEQKCEKLTKTTHEIREINKKQINDLEIRLSNSFENEKLLKSEVERLREKINKNQHELDKEKHASLSCKAELKNYQEEIQTLKHQKLQIFERQREQQNKIEKFEKDNESLQQIINMNQIKEKNLMRDMDTQKISLKTFYQKQLEDVVKQKLEEFQHQIDSIQVTMRNEGKQRERTIAERSIKQMELIIQKNEEEINLINEKNHEEISLYRIQLINASKQIEQLKEQLKSYQTRRADIAERLHNVMETQWQKALEIISNPLNNSSDDTKHQTKSKPKDQSNLNTADKKLSTKSNHKNYEQNDNNIYRTPTANYLTTNDQHSSSFNDTNSTEVKNYSDKLNDYIDMLLKKSPRDLEKLNEILEMVKKTPLEQNHSKSKPPWR